MFPYCALDWGLPWILRQYAILVLVGIKPLPATPQSTGLYLPVFKLNWSASSIVRFPILSRTQASCDSNEVATLSRRFLVSRVGFEPTFFLVPNQVPYQTRRTRVKRTLANAYNKVHSIPQSFDPHSLKEFYAYESVLNVLYYNKYFLFTKEHAIHLSAHLPF